MVSFYRVDQRREVRKKVAQDDVITSWQKPPAGKVKINSDATVELQKNMMGIGVIARDHEGNVLAMLCTKKEHISDPTMAEAVVAWRAVNLARRLDLQSIMLEGDALEIVQALQEDKGCWSTLYATVRW
jgi:hypothetical protein